MASGIVPIIDRIYSNEGTEWHRCAIPKQKILREEITDILWDIIESPAYMENNIAIPNYKILAVNLEGLRTEEEISKLGGNLHALHIPKSGYKVISNPEVWKCMEESLKDLDATITSVGTLEGGKKFFISVTIGDSEMIINKDKFKFFLNFVTSHDGTITMVVYDSAMRIVCMNTLRWSMNNQNKGALNFRVTHTKNASLALTNLPELINSIMKGRAELKDVMEYLETCKVDSKDAIAMAAGYFAETTGTKELSTRSMNAVNEISTLFTRGIECHGQSLYDLANAVTEYWTSGKGTGQSGASASDRSYRSAIGGAADHKSNFIAMLANENHRSEVFEKGKEALTLSLAN
jgi:hypothetical protein